MKISILIFCSSLLFLQKGIAQTGREKIKESTFSSKDFEEYPLSIKKSGFAAENLKTSLSSVSFIDLRADTSKFGFIRSGEYNTFHRFIFPDSAAADYITEKINKCLIKEKDNTGKLFFVLHQFWLSQVIVKSSLAKTLLTGGFGAKKYISYCYIDVDCYADTDKGLQYLGKVDSVISFKKWMGHCANDLVKESLFTTIAIGDSLFRNLKAANNIITNEQLIAKENNNYAYPILHVENPKKGVYLSYQDFLNNTPDEGGFEIKEKDKDKFIQSASLDTAKTNNAWGYNDGKSIYMHINDSYYKMNRVQNTFELVGPRSITKLYSNKDKIFIAAINTFFVGVLSGGLGLLYAASDEAIMKELVPYQLNIKEGSLY